MRSLLVALAALLSSTLTACTCAETTVSVSAPQGPIAVTASAVARLSSRSCRTFAFDNKGQVGKTDTVCAPSTGLDIGEAWVDDPSLFELTTGRSVVTLKALAPRALSRAPQLLFGEGPW